MKKLCILLSLLLLLGMFTGCQKEVAAAEPSFSAPAETAAETTLPADYPLGEKIDDQSFLISLNPLGMVEFVSYAPDVEDHPANDVVFQTENNGYVIQQLPGVFSDNRRLRHLFEQVEAVSFLDYNNDGFDDIITICSYIPAASDGHDDPFCEIRYYSGTAEGQFVYEEQMSMDASAALSEFTIQNAKDFIGYAPAPPEPWQQAYLDYLGSITTPTDHWGYTLIPLSDDEIPALVDVGAYEAAGCRVVTFAGGEVQVTQLSRLNFTYIPGSNLLCNSDGLMDNYYDIVYALEDGVLIPIAEGYYGAEDNSHVRFDENGAPIYIYRWQGVPMSEEEYREALRQVYDFTQAVGYSDDSLHTAEEMAEIIAHYNR